MTALLRLEYAALTALLLAIYTLSGPGWWLFAALILVPDLSFLGYLFGPRVGAIAYNVMHSWIGVVLLAAIAWTMTWPLGYTIALVWAIHIGFDRAMGYGLKYASGFKDTHLGRIGGS